MRLTSTDGSFIELEITGYQFPDGYEISGRRHFPDWLMVTGQARDPRTEWKFTYPCFYADEAREFGDWLRSIVDTEPKPTSLSFTEPNVSVQLVERTRDRSTLSFSLSQEFCPPDQPDEVRLDDGYCLRVEVNHEHLRNAAEAWLRDAARYPGRERSATEDQR